MTTTHDERYAAARDQYCETVLVPAGSAWLAERTIEETPCRY